MDSNEQIREFLTSRRANITPAEAGLPDFGGRRRVAGLRREEVALLAGMSVEYYVRLERGNAAGVSEAILDGISRALQLDDAEHAHLYDLVKQSNAGTHPQRRRGPTRPERVRSSVQQTIDAMADVPMYVQNGRLDLIATNRLARALFSPMYSRPNRPANFGRFVFIDPLAPPFYTEWDDVAEQTVALLRSEAGRAPHDRILSDLVGELSTHSTRFRALWASHDVREHRTGIKRVHHPVVGDLALDYEAMNLASDRGLQLIAFSAEPGTPTHDGLRLLASWAAEPVQRDALSDAPPADRP